MKGPPAVQGRNVPRPTTPPERPRASRDRLDVATVRSALALLREPLWARLALAVVLLSVAFFFLGRWQLGRHEAKVERNARIDANYSAAPVPVESVLPAPGSALPAGREWTQVRATGTYEADHQVLIRNRPLEGAFGFEVVVPLRLPSGAAFLVDRGWIPAGEDFVRPDTVPAPPAGQVTVVARVRPGEPPVDRTPPVGQELRIDLGRLAAVAGGTVYRGAYGVLATESPAPATAPTPLPRPDEDLGPHLAYAVQWWIGDVAAYALLGYYAVREARQRRSARGSGTNDVTDTEAAETGAAETGAADTGAAADAGEGAGEPGRSEPVRTSPGRVTRAARRWGGRRNEPTDEEWEDALSD